ncbi:MAG TPA: hypothetical protein VHD37_03185 [Candidatus Paceibacterota bacterium]|nr:hypothetical protein [Candidatus Paceibacterota bacterium]
MDSRQRPLLFSLFGAYFVIAGFGSLVASVATWHFGGSIPLLGLAYSGMNFALSRGFFLKEGWLLYALALNCGAYTLLYAAAWAQGGDANLVRFAISTALAAGAAGAAWRWRRALSPASFPYAAYAFLALWIFAFIETARTML